MATLLSLGAYYRFLLERSEVKDDTVNVEGGYGSLVKLVEDAIRQGLLSNDDDPRSSRATWRSAHRATFWILPHVDKVYAAHLLRKCIMTKFKVMCSSKTLPPAEYWRDIVEATEIFNYYLQHLKASLQLSFSRFVEEFVLSRANIITGRLLTHHCSQDAEKMATLIREEVIVVNSFVTAFNSSSSLLNDFSSIVEQINDPPVHHIFTKPPPASPLSLTTSTTSTTVFSSAKVSSAGLNNKQRYREETLKRIEVVVLNELWKRVAVSLCQKMACGGGLSLRLTTKKVIELLPPNRRELESATSCLLYVANRVSCEEELLEWDRGFQNMLALSQRRSSTKSQTSRPAEILCNSVLPPLRRTVTFLSPNSYRISSAHAIDTLRHSQSIIAPMTLSIHTVSHMLMTTLDLSVASSNLPLLAEYIFSQGPQINRHLWDFQQDLHNSLPLPSDLYQERNHMERRRFDASYDIMQAAITNMSERLEEVCGKFHDLVREKCRHCLQSVFPSVKQWKSIGKQGGVESSGRHSRYCDTLVDQLLGPFTEVALSLSFPAQSLFLSLSLTIFFTEFRHFILCHKQTYRIYAGKQLMVDFRYLLNWITAERLGLHQDTLNQIQSLSLVSEMEDGLQILCSGGGGGGGACGAKIPESNTQNPSSVTDGDGSDCDSKEPRYWVRGFSSLPVWTETAWHNLSDWKQCIL